MCFDLSPFGSQMRGGRQRSDEGLRAASGGVLLTAGATSNVLSVPGLEKGKWKVFTDAQLALFKAVPVVELSIAETSVDFVVKTLMQPRWWEAEDKYSSTTVSLVGSLSQGRVIYLRSVKSNLGPAKFRLRLWTTQWAEQLLDGSNGACVVCHSFDEGESCHLLTKFVVVPDKDKPDSVLVRYEELTSSPKVAVKLARNKIKKAHLFVLEVLAGQVAKNKQLPDPFLNTSDASQRSTDAVGDLTSASLGEELDSFEDKEGDSFDNENDKQIVLVDWQELPLDDVRAQMREPRDGVRVGDRSWRLKTYKNVFVGNEAVDYLVERYPLSREGATQLCQELQDQGWLQHVKNEHRFRDDHLFFVWRTPGSDKAISEVEMVDMSEARKAEAREKEEAKRAAEQKETAQRMQQEQQERVEIAKALPPSLFQTMVLDAPLENKMIGGFGFLFVISFFLGWSSLLVLCSLGLSFAAWRIGQSSVNEELRRVNRRLMELQDRLSESQQEKGVAPKIEPERDVALLTAQHREEIDLLRKELGAEIDKSFDDLVLLRYILSFKQVGEAAEAIRKAIAWRLENKDLLDRVTRGEQLPCRAAIARYAISDYHRTGLADGSPLLVTRAALCDLSSLIANVKLDDLVAWLNFLNEQAYREVDRVTRQTGRLTKVIRVNDLANAPLLNQDRGFFSAIGKSSKVASFLYPQLVEANILVNAPSLISIVLKIAAQFVSASTMSKVVLCKGRAVAGGNVADCPYASRRFKIEQLPQFWGGKCDCDHKGCIQGASNSAKSRTDM